MLRKFVRFTRTAWYQTVGNFMLKHQSQEAHGSQYEHFLSTINKSNDFDLESFQYQILTSRSLQKEHLNTASFPVLDTLDNDLLGTFNDVCIDIGAGTGWAANFLADRFTRVVAIEPNSNALEIANHFFGNSVKGNIEWHCGYAEEVLNELPNFYAPVFVITGVVLSHLPNTVAEKILATINTDLPVGSSGVLCEAWGSVRSENLWHIRSQSWWQRQLSNCELDFYGGEREGFPGEYLGLRFKKIRTS